MIDFGRSCSRHRPALVDFVDRGEVRAETAAALAHLDRCERCTAAIESTVLTITALRRYASSLDAAGPSPDAWPRLAARVTSWPRRSVSMSPLTGVAMSMAMALALVLPLQLGPGQLGNANTYPSTSSASTLSTQPDAVRVGQRPSVIDDNLATLPFDDGALQWRAVVNDDVVVTPKEVAESTPFSRLGWRI